MEKITGESEKKFSVIEGNRMLLDGGSMFGHTPKALWEKRIPADDKNRIQIATRNLLVQTRDGQNILFDVGVGTYLAPKFRERYGVTNEDHLIDNLAKLGLQEQDIHAIVLSHLHFDHAGGLLSSYEEGANRLRFPQATYYVSKEHWNNANHPHIRERASFIPLLHSLLANSGRLVLIEDKSHPALDVGLTFHFSHGHTVALMLSEFDVPEGPLLFASDLIPGSAWMHLPTVSGYDRFAELLIDEKRGHLERLLKQNGQVFFTHDPDVSSLRVTNDLVGSK